MMQPRALKDLIDFESTHTELSAGCPVCALIGTRSDPASRKKALANSVDPDETPHDAASHQATCGGNLTCSVCGPPTKLTCFWERVLNPGRGESECTNQCANRTASLCALTEQPVCVRLPDSQSVVRASVPTMYQPLRLPDSQSMCAYRTASLWLERVYQPVRLPDSQSVVRASVPTIALTGQPVCGESECTNHCAYRTASLCALTGQPVCVRLPDSQSVVRESVPTSALTGQPVCVRLPDSQSVCANQTASLCALTEQPVCVRLPDSQSVVRASVPTMYHPLRLPDSQSVVRASVPTSALTGQPCANGTASLCALTGQPCANGTASLCALTGQPCANRTASLCALTGQPVCVRLPDSQSVVRASVPTIALTGQPCANRTASLCALTGQPVCVRLPDSQSVCANRTASLCALTGQPVRVRLPDTTCGGNLTCSVCGPPTKLTCFRERVLNPGRGESECTNHQSEVRASVPTNALTGQPVCGESECTNQCANRTASLWLERVYQPVRLPDSQYVVRASVPTSVLTGQPVCVCGESECTNQCANGTASLWLERVYQPVRLPDSQSVVRASVPTSALTGQPVCGESECTNQCANGTASLWLERVYQPLRLPDSQSVVRASVPTNALTGQPVCGESECSNQCAYRTASLW
ncbi:hypothetical protein DPMN_007939 [Dreissena polymorpha]|uniref:Uncharacterized protein n=1 Tax=Dreissena polymorpha TaxID=45954 RepID=A0A9D4MY96_DREPO|nr:hypothetical protein DPMN_007939 [Dreissena polymorpha]